ncbi:hypothetical protein V8C35DRAFT_294569 [Trichoderma chlorosporum]
MGQKNHPKVDASSRDPPKPRTSKSRLGIPSFLHETHATPSLDFFSVVLPRINKARIYLVVCVNPSMLPCLRRLSFGTWGSYSAHCPQKPFTHSPIHPFFSSSFLFALFHLLLTPAYMRIACTRTCTSPSNSHDSCQWEKKKRASPPKMAANP